MASITFKGNPVKTSGELPKVGQQLPDFDLIASDLSHVNLKKYHGNRLVLNVFPSLDTGVCAASVRMFNKKAGELENTKVLCISRDLPFAQSRFCGAEGLNNVITLSDYATHDFGKKYGLVMLDGPLAHLLSRVVMIADESGKVIYTEQVPEIVQEPDYEKAMEAL